MTPGITGSSCVKAKGAPNSRPKPPGECLDTAEKHEILVVMKRTTTIDNSSRPP
jgi:hypothetical protein